MGELLAMIGMSAVAVAAFLFSDAVRAAERRADALDEQGELEAE